MSHIFLVSYRHAVLPPGFTAWTQRLNTRLAPDNITPHPTRIAAAPGLGLALLNPLECVSMHATSACLGSMLAPHEDWWQPGSPAPDGAYALVRADQHLVELLSDVAATRTLWYVHTDELFAASTSQRALVAWLGSFQPDLSTLPWMLSSGTLGPQRSWDARIKPLPGDARLTLDRRSWQLNLHTQPVVFQPSDQPSSELLRNFGLALGDLFDAFRIDPSRWLLSLSGGYDSRAILLLLRQRQGLRCVTWGLPSALREKNNDAQIAQQLAAHFNLPHTYYQTRASDEDLERILRRFILAGEGRIDHIGAYMDGFTIWRNFFRQGVCGVLRGDVAFPSIPVFDDLDVRRTLGLTLLEDYTNLPGCDVWDLQPQCLPEDWRRQPHESMLTWRDRLFQVFSLPVIKASLNMLKSGYVEVINPLIARRLVYPYRCLPDDMRVGKQFFKQVIGQLSPGISFARQSALGFKSDILSSPAVVAWLQDELGSSNASQVLPQPLLQFLLHRIHSSDARLSSRLRVQAQKMIPKKLRRRIRSRMGKPAMNFNELGFRASIITVMHAMLNKDAAWGVRWLND